jgi:hypothetical protein
MMLLSKSSQEIGFTVFKMATTAIGLLGGFLFSWKVWPKETGDRSESLRLDLLFELRSLRGVVLALEHKACAEIRSNFISYTESNHRHRPLRFAARAHSGRPLDRAR